MIVNRGSLETLYRGFNAAFRSGFEAAPAQHRPFTMFTSSVTLHEEYGWLGQFPSLREWVGERILRGIQQQGYVIRNKLYEATVEVARTHIEDDHLGVYSPLFEEMGMAAMDHQSEMVFGLLKRGFAELCYDGQYFFDADHPDGKGGTVSNNGGGNGSPWFLLDARRAIKPVIFQERVRAELVQRDDMADEAVFMRDMFQYGTRCRDNAGFGLWQTAYGSKQALTPDNYETARQAMMAFKGDEGRPLGIIPTHLVVGPALEREGLALVNAERLENGASNVYHGTADLVVSPWLA